jgi:hypothetical protein
MTDNSRLHRADYLLMLADFIQEQAKADTPIPLCDTDADLVAAALRQQAIRTAAA